MGVREYNIPWLVKAKSYIGLKETPGSKNNPTIMEWAKDQSKWIKDVYTGDDVPWCGLFVAECIKSSDIDVSIKNPLSALEWRNFGVKTDPCFGCIMVFSRNGGGHVGFYISEDSSSFHILGGNQSDSVNITRISKDRWVDARWPKDLEHLKKPGRIVTSFSGKISTNEA